MPFLYCRICSKRSSIKSLIVSPVSGSCCSLCFMMYQMLSLAKRFSEYETMGSLFRSECDQLQMLTLWSRTLEEVRHLLEVLSQEAGVDLLVCLSTVAARQTADFSTKVWAHLLCDSDDLAMPDLC